MITSRSNAKIKDARALRQRKYRRQYGRFLVEGIHHVGQAAQAGVLESIFYAPELLSSDFAHEVIEEQAEGGVPCYATSVDVFSTLADKSNPQGIVGVARVHTSALDVLSPESFWWGVALVAPQDPGNVGTILRTIDAVGASGLILLEESVDPYHPRSVRASMGTLFWYPIVETSFADFTQWARRWRYHIYGTSVHADQDYTTRDSYEKPCILLLGSERQGLTSNQAAICEHMLRIPMGGHASSLNLSIAAGVMLYAMYQSFSDSKHRHSSAFAGSG